MCVVVLCVWERGFLYVVEFYACSWYAVAYLCMISCVIKDVVGFLIHVADASLQGHEMDT